LPIPVLCFIEVLTIRSLPCKQHLRNTSLAWSQSSSAVFYGMSHITRAGFEVLRLRLLLPLKGGDTIAEGSRGTLLYT
jgi:hypothetical protein